jgi:hypothetical protein
MRQHLGGAVVNTMAITMAGQGERIGPGLPDLLDRVQNGRGVLIHATVLPATARAQSTAPRARMSSIHEHPQSPAASLTTVIALVAAVVIGAPVPAVAGEMP